MIERHTCMDEVLQTARIHLILQALRKRLWCNRCLSLSLWILPIQVFMACGSGGLLREDCVVAFNWYPVIDLLCRLSHGINLVFSTRQWIRP